MDAGLRDELPLEFTDRDRERRWWAGYGIGLGLLPLLFLLWKLYAYGMGFPYWDAWELIPFLEHIEAGALSMGDLWVQHNEHRIVFPRMIMLALARWTAWNTAYEIAFGVACTAALWAALSAFALRHVPDRGLPRPWWCVAAFSFLLFSWSQMENWVWGWQFLVFMSNAAAGFGMLLLYNAGAVRFAAAIALGVVATYSFANGALYWIAALPVAAWASDLAPRQRLRRLGVWMGVALVCVALYAIGYRKPEVTPSLGVIVEAPLALLGFVVLYIGAPVTALFARVPWHGPQGVEVSVLHFVPGAAGLLGFAALLVLHGRAQARDAAGAAAAADAAAAPPPDPGAVGFVWPRAAMLPWVGLALYALGSAAITAAGRAGYGIGFAMTSAYITIPTLFWCALIAMLAAWMQPRQPLLLASDAVKIAVPAAGALGMLACFAGVSWANRDWQDVARWRAMGWEALRAGIHAPLFLQDISAAPERLRDEYLPWCAERGYAGLGAGAPPLRFTAQAYRDECRRFIERKLQAPALTYLQAAETLDPLNAEHAELRRMGQEAFGGAAP